MYVMYVNDSAHKIKIHKACVESGYICGCKHLFKFCGNDNPQNISNDYYKLFTNEENALSYARAKYPDTDEKNFFCAFCEPEKAGY